MRNRLLIVYLSNILRTNEKILTGLVILLSGFSKACIVTKPDVTFICGQINTPGPPPENDGFLVGRKTKPTG